MLIEIKHRWNDSVLFSHNVDNNTVEITLKEALKQGADLRGAYLRGAYLRGAYLRGKDEDILEKTPLYINELYWIVTITTKHLTIGCKHHSHEEWANFSEQEIEAMDSHAAEFWKVWKAPLLALCAAHKL